VASVRNGVGVVLAPFFFATAENSFMSKEATGNGLSLATFAAQKGKVSTGILLGVEQWSFEGTAGTRVHFATFGEDNAAKVGTVCEIAKSEGVAMFEDLKRYPFPCVGEMRTDTKIKNGKPVDTYFLGFTPLARLEAQAL